MYTRLSGKKYIEGLIRKVLGIPHLVDSKALYPCN